MSEIELAEQLARDIPQGTFAEHFPMGVRESPVCNLSVCRSGHVVESKPTGKVGIFGRHRCGKETLVGNYCQGCGCRLPKRG